MNIKNFINWISDQENAVSRPIFNKTTIIEPSEEISELIKSLTGIQNSITGNSTIVDRITNKLQLVGKINEDFVIVSESRFRPFIFRINPEGLIHTRQYKFVDGPPYYWMLTPIDKQVEFIDEDFCYVKYTWVEEYDDPDSNEVCYDFAPPEYILYDNVNSNPDKPHYIDGIYFESLDELKILAKHIKHEKLIFQLTYSEVTIIHDDDYTDLADEVEYEEYEDLKKDSILTAYQKAINEIKFKRKNYGN